MQPTDRYEKITVVRVSFSEEEFALLLEKVGDYQPGAEAKFIHDTVVNNLQRWKKRQQKGAQS